MGISPQAGILDPATEVWVCRTCSWCSIKALAHDDENCESVISEFRALLGIHRQSPPSLGPMS